MTVPPQPTPPPAPAPRPPRTAGVVLAALVVLGVALLCVAAWVASRPTSYGWFAYAPLSNTTFTPGSPGLSGRAALLAGAGALLIGGAVGFLVGRAGRPTPAPAPGRGTSSGDDTPSAA